MFRNKKKKKKKGFLLYYQWTFFIFTKIMKNFESTKKNYHFLLQQLSRVHTKVQTKNRKRMKTV